LNEAVDMCAWSPGVSLFKTPMRSLFVSDEA